MRFRNPYVCLRRCYSTFNPTPGPATAAPRLPPPPPASGVSNLVRTRRLLEIHGVDAAKYLQAVTTTNIPLFSERGQRGGVYSAFLNPTGRVLHDVFIYPINHSPHWRKTSFAPLDPCFFIEYDVVSEERLLEHIGRYKLRSKFSVRPLDPGDWNLWYTWDDTTTTTTPTALEETETIFASDTRCPNFGTRLILPSADPRPNPQHPQVFAGTYKVRRILHGIPEGRSEMAEFPLESNMDYMGGIDFRKGCYVGQELTIRTHHTGVVRKRIYPVQLYRSDPELPMPLEAERLVYDLQDTTIPIHPALKEPKGQGEEEGEERAHINRANRKGRRAGQVLTAVGNVGLAVCRIEVMTDLVLEAGTGLERTRTPWDEFVVRWHVGMSTEAKSFNVKAFVPEWHPRKVPDDGSERKGKEGR